MAETRPALCLLVKRTSTKIKVILASQLIPKCAYYFVDLDNIRLAPRSPYSQGLVRFFAAEAEGGYTQAEARYRKKSIFLEISKNRNVQVCL